MKQRVVLYADEGMVLTNGKIFGKTVYLAEGAQAADFHEIDQEEYERMMAEEAAAGKQEGR